MNKRWITKDNVYKLMFTPFNDEECVLTFVQHPDDPKCFIYASDWLNVEYDEEFARDVVDAMGIFEGFIEDHIIDEMTYYETLLDAWRE